MRVKRSLVHAMQLTIYRLLPLFARFSFHAARHAKNAGTIMLDDMMKHVPVRAIMLAWSCRAAIINGMFGAALSSSLP